MSGRGSRRMAARLLSAAASAALACAPALAQSPQTAPPQTRRRRPARPSSTHPRRSIRCPTLASIGPTSMPTDATPAPAGPKGQASASAVTDENSEIRYTIEVEGLAPIGQFRRAARDIP